VIFTNGVYPKPSKVTISNAMDVGNQVTSFEFRKCTTTIWNNSKDFSSYTFTDEETTEAMKVIYGTSGYIGNHMAPWVI
jgi:threonine synthase